MSTRKDMPAKYAMVYEHLKKLPGGMLQCEIAKMLGIKTKNTVALITTMEASGFLLYEDEDDRLHAFENKNERKRI